MQANSVVSIRKRTQRPSEKQKKALVEFIKKNPQIIASKFSNSFTQKDAEAEWKKITDTLNSVPNGAIKEWSQWRKTWQDLRARTKNKISVNKKNAGKTGGGEAEEECLSTMEEEVFQIIKKVSVEGHAVPESKVSLLSFDDPVTVQEPDTFYDQAEASQSLKQIVNEEDNCGTSAETSTQQHQQIQPFNITSIIMNPKENCTNSTEKCGKNIKQKTHNKLSKKLENFMNSAEASTALKENLDKKIQLKENYYSEKLTILRDIARSKQEKVIELRRLADILEGRNEKHTLDNILMNL